MAHAWANACLIGVRSHSRVHIGRWRPAWRGPRHAHDLSRSSCCVESSVRASSSIDYCNYTRVLRSTGLRLRVSIFFTLYPRRGFAFGKTGFMPRIHDDSCRLSVGLGAVHGAVGALGRPTGAPPGPPGSAQWLPGDRLSVKFNRYYCKCKLQQPRANFSSDGTGCELNCSHRFGGFW